MGVTFKISKIGSRYRQQPQLENAEEDNVAGSSKDSSRVVGNNDSVSTSAQNPEVNAICGAGDVTEMPDCEVSFLLNLFPDSYSVTKPSVNESGNQDSQKLSRPYDKTCEILSTAIERGQLPEDILGDFPFKYVDGAIVCEVRDYRKCTPGVGTTTPSSSLSPIIQKVRLKMSLANIVKDMQLISDDTWTYGDMMEVESRILRALEPKLLLDPTPKLGRLCTNPVINKLNLDVSSIRRKRLKQNQDTINTSNCALNGKNGYIDRVPESSVSMLGESGLPSIMPQDANENISTQNVSSIPNMITSRIKYGVTDPSTTLLPLTTQQLQQPQIGMANQRLMMLENSVSGPLMNVPGASPVSQEPMYSYANNIANVHGKREYQDGPNSHLSSVNKQMRVTVANAEAVQQQQQIGQHMDNFQASNIQWKNPRGGMQYQNSSGTQKYPQQIYEDALALNNGGQPGMRLIAKDEPIEMERFDKQETNPIKSEMQQRLPPQHAFMRSNFSQTPWNNQGQPLEMSARKDEQSQKRKTAQSPRISVGGFPQSPLSSKSGEFSSGSMGPQFGPAVTSSLAVSQKDKAAVNSKPTAGGGATSSDSLQRHSHVVAKRRPNSQPKNSAISGVSSPATAGNMSIVPLNTSSPPVGTSLIDPKLIERLTKIDMVSTRFKLNSKTNNKGVESYHVRNPGKFPSEHVSAFLSNDMNFEFPRDETCKMPLSKSLIGGNLNVNKIRVLNFVMPESNLQGGERFPAVPRTRTRMIMSEKSNDDAIAIHFGDLDDNEFLAAEEYLPTLPTAHYADLLAAELCSQMIHSGYHVQDHLQVKPLNRTNHPLSNQPNTTPGTPSGNPLIEIQQNSDSVFSQLTTEAPKPTNSGNTTTTRMLPPLNNQPLQISQGLLQSIPLPSSRPLQQPDTQTSSLQQQPQPSMTSHPSIQQPASQFQRSSSSVMLPGNNNNTLLSQMNANQQMGNNPMSYGRPSSVQLQMMQQQQQQQTPQLQRKMMMGLGPAANNISGLAGIGNIMGMGGGGSGGVGQRGIGVGPTAMSSQMGQISGMGNNVGQNPMSLGQATNINNVLRSGQLTPTQAQIMAKLKMAQTRANMLAVAGGGPQATGARQMHHPGSTTTTSLQMLGQTPNRGNLNPNQNRSAIMGPPKIMSGMNNMYMNPQQQLQHQQLQFQQMHHFQQQQLLQQQQQESTTSSPLQSGLITASSSPQVVGSSPSTMSMNQMMNQQMLQQANAQQMPQQASSQHMNQQQMNQQQQVSAQQMNQQQMQQQVSAQQMNQQHMQQQTSAQQMNQQQMQQQTSAQQMNQQQMQQQTSAQQMNQQQTSVQQMNQQQVSAQQMNQQQMQLQASAQQMNQQQMQQQASGQQMNQQQASGQQMNQQMQQQASGQQMIQQQASGQQMIQQQASGQQMNQMQQQASAQQMNQQQMQQQASAHQMNQQQMQQQVNAQQIHQQASAQHQMMKQQQMQQQQVSAQLMNQQQANAQQMNQRTTQMSPQQQMNQRTAQMSPQLSSGPMMHPTLSTGNVEASCTPSPPLNNNNNNNSSVELQGRTSSTNNG